MSVCRNLSLGPGRQRKTVYGREQVLHSFPNFSLVYIHRPPIRPPSRSVRALSYHADVRVVSQTALTEDREVSVLPGLLVVVLLTTNNACMRHSPRGRLGGEEMVVYDVLERTARLGCCRPPCSNYECE